MYLRFSKVSGCGQELGAKDSGAWVSLGMRMFTNKLLSILYSVEPVAIMTRAIVKRGMIAVLKI